MTSSTPSESSTQQRPGRIDQALRRLFMKQATVVSVEPIGARFRLITLESPAFVGFAWTPGQKVQVALSKAFVSRTYTPIEWDAATGRTRVLAYAHGAGPGSEWVSSLKSGAQCDIFGPRGSLDVGSSLDGPVVVVVGDETSIGLAHAAARQQPARNVYSLLEVESVADTQLALDKLGLGEAELFARQAGDAHLAQLEQRLLALALAHAAEGASFVLTGKASSVQQLRRALKAAGVPAKKLLTKAYWAPGKTGLD